MSIESMKLALLTLEQPLVNSATRRIVVRALREAIAKAEPHPPTRHCMCESCTPSFEAEPAAKYIGEGHEGSLIQLYEYLKKGTDLYTHPRPAQKPLTESQITSLMYDTNTLPECLPTEVQIRNLVRAVEAYCKGAPK